MYGQPQKNDNVETKKQIEHWHYVLAIFSNSAALDGSITSMPISSAERVFKITEHKLLFRYKRTSNLLHRS